MERLTQWIGESEDRKAIARQDRRDIGDKDCVTRLAEYEDTGLTPEEFLSHKKLYQEDLTRTYGPMKQRVVELLKADQDGRLLVLPFAPGDECWAIERDENGVVCDVTGYMFLAQSSEFVILSSYINCMENIDDILEYHAQETSENGDTYLMVFPSEDVYKTREEAAAALKGGAK